MTKVQAKALPQMSPWTTGVILIGADGARERYLTFLKSGGSDHSLNILRRAGINLTGAEPFEHTLRLFEAQLDEGEALWRP